MSVCVMIGVNGVGIHLLIRKVLSISGLGISVLSPGARLIVFFLYIDSQDMISHMYRPFCNSNLFPNKFSAFRPASADIREVLLSIFLHILVDVISPVF